MEIQNTRAPLNDLQGIRAPLNDIQGIRAPLNDIQGIRAQAMRTNRDLRTNKDLKEKLRPNKDLKEEKQIIWEEYLRYLRSCHFENLKNRSLNRSSRQMGTPKILTKIPTEKEINQNLLKTENLKTENLRKEFNLRKK